MNSNETIQYLIDEGKITKEDIQEAERNALSDTKKDIILRIHLQFCERDHDPNDGSAGCDWYVEEEQHKDCWQQPSHQRWVKLFNDFLRSANFVKFIPKSIGEESTGSSDDSSLSE